MVLIAPVSERLQVVNEIDAATPCFVQAERGHRQTQRVPIGEPSYINSTASSERDIPPRSGIDLDYLKHAIAVVVFEFSVENTAIGDRNQQTLQSLNRGVHLGQWHGDHHAAVSELPRIKAQSSAGEPGADPTMTIHKSVDVIRGGRRTRDILLQHDRELQPGGYVQSIGPIIENVALDPILFAEGLGR